MSYLPASWTKATVGDLFCTVGGGTPSTGVPEYWQGSIPWISSADIDDTHHLSISRFISKQAIEHSAVNLVPSGSVIIVTRVGLGKVAVASVPLCFSQDKQALLFNQDHFDTNYVLHFMSTAVKMFKHISRGTTISGVTKRQLLETEFVLPPRPEQSRLVAEIEKQFTRLDAANAALKRVQANLKRYRASVLKAACEGCLVPTEAELARKEGREYEPADKLLQRILRERRARWEADTLEKMIASGKPPKDGRWKEKYKEPSGPDPNFSFRIPEGWCLASMDQLTSRITSGSRDWSTYYGRGMGTFVMAQNVRPGWFDLSVKQSVDPPKNDSGVLRCLINEHDLLVTIVGANTGDVCLVPDKLFEHYVCQSVALIRPVLSSISSYLEVYMNSDEYGQLIYKRYTYGAGRPHLSFEQLKATPVLLPPEHEAVRISELLAQTVPTITHQHAAIESQLPRLSALRNSILKSAFSGKLVPQDPNDESASVLLERIARERSAPKQRRIKVRPGGKELVHA